MRAARRLAVLATLAGLGYAVRRQLVAVLTATTGTWVGSPESPRRDAAQ